MDAFDILILVLGIVTGGILFALGLPFYMLLIYFVSIMFSVSGCVYCAGGNSWNR